MLDFTKPCPEPFLLAHATMIQDYCEWTGEDPFEVADKILHFKELTKREFQRLGGDFYEQSSTYIYDILGGNPTAGIRANLLNKFIPYCVQLIKMSGPKFADFGAGIGAVCEIAVHLGKEVTHIDLPSRTLEFAQWRYAKYGWPVKLDIIDENDFDLAETHDVILTDAVWEHLPPDQQEGYAEKITKYVNKNGLLIFLVDLAGPSPEMPMHFNVDIVKVHDAIERGGMVNEFGRNYFASVWRKP
jgi:2-polyprenyl-3-methyl-5-hydroxy-6-metoxy-1,4-benzoquinol methylase